MDLPTEHEASLATAGKEITWSKLSGEDRSAFQKAADEQWQKWTENGSVQELSVQESRRMQEDLTRTGKSGDLLTPRWVLTDKNAALSTPANPLPLKPSARLVVPGFKDTVHSGSVEKHGNLRETAWKDDCARMPPRRRGLRSCFCARWQRTSPLGSWRLRTSGPPCDVYMAGSRTLFMQQPDRRKGPTLPGVRFGVIFRVLNGVFGLADAPRQWYLDLAEALPDPAKARVGQECPGRGTVLLTVTERRATGPLGGPCGRPAVRRMQGRSGSAPSNWQGVGLWSLESGRLPVLWSPDSPAAQRAHRDLHGRVPPESPRASSFPSRPP